MRLVDLIINGGDIQGDGEVTPVALQAATQRAQRWLEGIALKIGLMIDGVLLLYEPRDIELAFNEMPEEYFLI